MIAGLPWTAWLLLTAAVGVGLAIQIAHTWRARTDRDDRSDRRSG